MLRRSRGSLASIQPTEDPWAFQAMFVSEGYAAFPLGVYADLASVPAGVIWMGTFDGVRGGYVCSDFIISGRVPTALSLGADLLVSPPAIFVETFVVIGGIPPDLSLGTDWTVTPTHVFANVGIAGPVPDGLTVGTDWTETPTQVFAVAGI